MNPKQKLAQIVKKHGIGKTAEKLGYSYAYIHQTLHNTIEPGNGLLKSINALYHKEFDTPKPPAKPRGIITFDHDDPLAEYFNSLPMEERRQMVQEHQENHL